MRRNFLGNLMLVTVLIASLQPKLTTAQSYVPDPDVEAACKSHYFYQNLGQVADDSGNLHPEVLYHTDRASPAMYFAMNRVSFVTTKADNSGGADSSFRIDMRFTTELETYPQAYEQSSDHLNFYLPHCSGGVTNVPGYAGIEYNNVFVNTDVHFYSNNTTLKSYFRFKVGAVPANFGLEFSGHDSISALTGILQIYSGSMSIAMPPGIAYQVGPGGTILPLGWKPTWYDAGGGVAMLNIGSYDPTKELIFRFGVPDLKVTGVSNDLDWATYYGGVGDGENNAIISSDGTFVNHAMGTSTGAFPPLGQRARAFTGGYSDIYISQFNLNGERQWATYFGGSDYERAWAICNTASTANGGGLFVGGETQSNNMPGRGSSISSYQQNVFGGFIDGFIANFSNATGELFFATYIGGNALDEVRGLAADVTDGITQLYFCGRTGSNNTSGSSSAPPPTGQFPVYQGSSGTAYFQATNAGGWYDGFVGSFNVYDFSLSWSTFMGGNDYDEIYVVRPFTNGSGNKVYCGGYTTSNPPSSVPTSPITAPSPGKFPLVHQSGAFFHNNFSTSSGDNDAFIACFDNSRQLSWSTYFGGNGDEAIYDIATNSAGDVYAVGSTSTSGSILNNQLLASVNRAFPRTYSSGMYGQTYGGALEDAFITRFSAGSHAMSWCTYYGGAGDELAWQNPYPRVMVDANNAVYMTGFTTYDQVGSPTSGSCSTKARAGWYNQAANASAGAGESGMDGYIVQFKSNNTWNWATHFGGKAGATAGADENLTGATLAGQNPTNLFITGRTTCVNTPVSPKPTGPSLVYYDDQLDHVSTTDIYIAKFANLDVTGVSVPDIAGSALSRMVVTPNPASGDIELIFDSRIETAKLGRVVLTNAIGQTVQTKEIRVRAGENRFRMDISGKAAGIYFVNLSVGDDQSNAKIVVK